MPELAEVAYYAAQWNPGLSQKILRVHTGPKPRFFRNTHSSAFAALAGTTYRHARTHGTRNGLSCREVYPYDWEAAGPDDPAGEVACPYQPRG